MAWQVRTITAGQHLDYLKTLPSNSFLQCPAWGQVKTDWRSECLGWFDDHDRLGGVGLVLYRQIARLGWNLAYFPEGPVINWHDSDLESYLKPMINHVQQRKAFSVRMGPPVITHRWQADTLKAALAAHTDLAHPGPAHAAPRPGRLGELAADHTDAHALAIEQQLRALGWRAPRASNVFAQGQPQYGFQLQVHQHSDEQLLAGFNQQWRRNIKKAERAQVQVEQVGPQLLPIFHHLYRITAQRDHFTPRPLAYFERLYQAMNHEQPGRVLLYVASRHGQPLAAALCLQVGQHWWYAYGASDHRGNQYRPSNALQWQMMRDARDAGAHVYDLRGITATLDPADPLVGLLRFKLGTGGQAVRYLGEWDLPLHRPLATAFAAYNAARSVRTRRARPAPAVAS